MWHMKITARAGKLRYRVLKEAGCLTADVVLWLGEQKGSRHEALSIALRQSAK
jgi:hypothetical protein